MQNTFLKRINKVVTEIKNMKMNQVIGGDSWVVYRAEIDYTTVPSREYLVIFSPEVSGEYVAVCKVTSPDRGIYGSIGDLMPDPNVAGRWYRPYQVANNNQVLQTFFVYSSVKGSVSVQDVTGKDIGTTV